MNKELEHFKAIFYKAVKARKEKTDKLNAQLSELENKIARLADQQNSLSDLSDWDKYNALAKEIEAHTEKAAFVKRQLEKANKEPLFDTEKLKDLEIKARSCCKETYTNYIDEYVKREKQSIEEIEGTLSDIQITVTFVNDVYRECGIKKVFSYDDVCMLGTRRNRMIAELSNFETLANSVGPLWRRDTK